MNQFGMANYVQLKKNKIAKFSDHYGLFMELQLSFSPIREERIVQYNFRNKSGQDVFSKITNSFTILTKYFQNSLSLEDQFKMWRKSLEDIFSQSFKKIRVTSSKKKENSEISRLLDERRLLVRKLARNPDMEEVRENICLIEQKIGGEVSTKNRQLVSENLAAFGAQNGGTNIAGAWALKKKIRPKNKAAVPVGKKDGQGNIVTDQHGLKVLYLETFVWRLRERPIRPDLGDVKQMKEKCFDQILELCSKTKSKKWTSEDLDIVLKSLKTENVETPMG